MKVNSSLVKTPSHFKCIGEGGGFIYDPMGHEHLMYLNPKPTSCIKGLFTPWTMKSSQGPVKFVIRC